MGWSISSTFLPFTWNSYKNKILSEIRHRIFLSIYRVPPYTSTPDTRVKAMVILWRILSHPSVVPWFHVHVERSYLREVRNSTGGQPWPALYPYQQWLLATSLRRPIRVVQPVKHVRTWTHLHVILDAFPWPWLQRFQIRIRFWKQIPGSSK